MARECILKGKARFPSGDSTHPWDTLIAFETADDHKAHAGVAKGWPATDAEIKKAMEEALKEEVRGIGTTYTIP